MELCHECDNVTGSTMDLLSQDSWDNYRITWLEIISLLWANWNITQYKEVDGNNEWPDVSSALAGSSLTSCHTHPHIDTLCALVTISIVTLSQPTQLLTAQFSSNNNSLPLFITRTKHYTNTVLKSVHSLKSSCLVINRNLVNYKK